MDKLLQNLHVLLWACKERDYNMSREKALDIFSRRAGVPQERITTFLLKKDVPSNKEITQIASAFYFEVAEIYHGDLLDNYGINFLRENISYLFSLIPRGKAEFARRAKIDPTTVNNWVKRGQMPEKSNLKKISEYFGLSEEEDLTQAPLFLELKPAGAGQRKRECQMLIDEMPTDEFAKLYPALKKLLS